MAKCGILVPDINSVPELIHECVTETKIPLYTGAMQTLGSIVGTHEPTIRNWLNKRTASFDQFFRLLSRDDLSTQIAMTLLRESTVPSLGHLARVLPPSLLKPFAERFDDMVVKSAATKLEFPDPPT